MGNMGGCMGRTNDLKGPSSLAIFMITRKLSVCLARRLKFQPFDIKGVSMAAGFLRREKGGLKIGG